MATPATRALAEGRMVAGMVPEFEAIRRHEAREADRAKSLPNGAQLCTWRQQEVDAMAERRALRKHNRERRGVTWLKWTIGWAPKEKEAPDETARFDTVKRKSTHARRRKVLAYWGVPNTGRQWVRFRKSSRRGLVPRVSAHKRRAWLKRARRRVRERAS